MATNHQSTHPHVFTPFLRFLVALTVVAFFHSWEPGHFFASFDQVVSKPIQAKAAAPSWKYVKTNIDDRDLKSIPIVKP